MKRPHVCLVLLVLLFTVSAYAGEKETPKDIHTWYGKLGAGYVIPFDSHEEERFGLSEWEFEDGFNGLVSLGYQHANWAVELEGSYKKLDADYVQTRRTGERNGLTGDQTRASGMVNVYYIFMPEQDISTYFGIGAGMTHVSWNDVKSADGVYIDDSDLVFTYQAIAGVSFDLTRRIALEFDYRFVRPDDVDISDMTGTVRSFNDQQVHIVTGGFKFRF